MKENRLKNKQTNKYKTVPGSIFERKANSVEEGAD
jgi:hypothetical protein